MANKKQEKLYIFFRESLLQSIIADAFLFGLIIGSIVVNRFYLGDKWYLDLFFIFMAFVTVINRQNPMYKRFTNKEELKKFVDNL